MRTHSRMLLKGDGGVQNLEGGVAENGDFRQGGHYPLVILALRVTGIVPLPLSDPSTQRSMNGWSPKQEPDPAARAFLRWW
jgi:hypothetical protein